MYRLEFENNTFISLSNEFVKSSLFLTESFEAFEEEDEIKSIKVPNIVTFELMNIILSIKDSKDVVNMSLEKSIELLKCVDFLYIDTLSNILTDHICRCFYDNNILLQILNKYPCKHWNNSSGIKGPSTISYLSANNINMKYVNDHIDYKWEWDRLSSNPGITIQDIIDNPHYKWDWHYISRNRSIRKEDIINNPELPWKWGGIVFNKSMDISFLISNQDKRCTNDDDEESGRYLEGLFSHPKLFMSNLIKIDKPWPPWIWNYISENPNLTLEFFKENLNEKWCYASLSENECLTVEFVKCNPTAEWVWDRISWHIKLEDIENNLSMPWEWDAIAHNTNLTIEFVKKYKNNFDKEDWGYISQNIGISMNDIQENIHLPWKLKSAQWNPNVSVEFLKKYANTIQLSVQAVTMSPNFTVEDIEELQKLSLIHSIKKYQKWSLEHYLKKLKKDQKWSSEPRLKKLKICSRKNIILKKYNMSNTSVLYNPNSTLEDVDRAINLRKKTYLYKTKRILIKNKFKRYVNISKYVYYKFSPERNCYNGISSHTFMPEMEKYIVKQLDSKLSDDLTEHIINEYEKKYYRSNTDLWYDEF